MRKNFGPIMYDITGKWRLRKNGELEEMYNEKKVVESIRKRRLLWAEYTMKNQNSLLRAVL